MARLDSDIIARLGRLAQDEKLELLAVEVVGTARKATVRLVIDREEGGVTLEHCESVSRQASVLLDAYDPLPGAYTLEVSSPGLDRKLYNQRDYQRFAGRFVKVRMRPSFPGEKVLEGVLEGLHAGVVRLRDGEDVVHELPEGEVFEARLAPFAEERLRARQARQQARRGKQR